MRKIRTYLTVTALGLSHTENHTAREVEKSNGFPCKFSTAIFYFVESRIMCEVIFPSHSSLTWRKKKRGSFNREVWCPAKPQEKHSLGSTPVRCSVCPSSPYPISDYSVSQGQGSPIFINQQDGHTNDVYCKIRNQPKYTVRRNLLLCQEDKECQETQVSDPRSQVHRENPSTEGWCSL